MDTLALHVLRAEPHAFRWLVFRRLEGGITVPLSFSDSPFAHFEEALVAGGIALQRLQRELEQEHSEAPAHPRAAAGSGHAARCAHPGGPARP